MALYRATIKRTHTTNGVHLEKGMSVEIPTTSSGPFNNGAHEVIDAFMRKYGLDIKKAGAANQGDILLEKL